MSIIIHIKFNSLFSIIRKYYKSPPSSKCIFSHSTHIKRRPQGAPFHFCHFAFSTATLLYSSTHFQNFHFRIFINHIINQFNQVIISFCSATAESFFASGKVTSASTRSGLKSGTAAQQSLLKRCRSACRVLTQAPRRERLSAPQILPLLLSGRRLPG